MFIWFRTAALAAIALVAISPGGAADPAPTVAAQPAPPASNVAPYYPSPMAVVRRMLEAGELEAEELHYDLGSGDGRIVIAAASEHGARSVGFEIDPKLVDSSRKRLAALGIEDRARIEMRDLFAVDYSKPDLITVYLLPRALGRLRPLLEDQMKPGSRVVSHDFAIPGWEPDETILLDEELEIDALPHTIYLYRIRDRK